MTPGPVERSLPQAGEHGGDGPAVAAALGLDPADLLDLSQSLNPFASDPAPVVAAHVDAVGRYPDPRAATHALAEAMDVDPDRLLLTNGGAEAIALVAAELGSGRVDEPDFALYRRHLELDPAGPLFRSNPHNPTGLLAGADERAAVWDEAFYPLATGSWTRGDPGSLVVGSLTKLLACPGLRLGYVLAPTAAALEPIAGRQPAWAVNGLAAGALPELLATVDLRGVVAPDRPRPRRPGRPARRARSDRPPVGRPLGAGRCPPRRGRASRGGDVAGRAGRPRRARAGLRLLRDARHRAHRRAGAGRPGAAGPSPGARPTLGRSSADPIGLDRTEPARTGLERPTPSDRKRSVILQPLLDAVLVDLGGTVVVEAAPGTPVADLQVELRSGVIDDLRAIASTTCGSVRSPTPPS